MEVKNLNPALTIEAEDGLLSPKGDAPTGQLEQKATSVQGSQSGWLAVLYRSTGKQSGVTEQLRLRESQASRCLEENRTG